MTTPFDYNYQNPSLWRRANARNVGLRIFNDLVVDNLLQCITFPPTQHTASFETKSPYQNPGGCSEMTSWWKLPIINRIRWFYILLLLSSTFHRDFDLRINHGCGRISPFNIIIFKVKKRKTVMVWITVSGDNSLPLGKVARFFFLEPKIISMCVVFGKRHNCLTGRNLLCSVL